MATTDGVIALTDSPPMTRTLWQICTQEYFPLNMRIRSAGTRYQYKIAVNCLGRSLGREATDDDLSDDSITLWMGRLLTADPPLSINTVRERVNRITALWGWLAKRNPGMRWPTVVKPQAPDSLPQALTEAQIRRLFSSARKERGAIGGVPADIWWTSFFGFVWATAERKAAAMALRIECLDLVAGVATIPPASRKGGRKWGVYQLWPELLPLLREAVAVCPQRDLVWPWDRCPGAYYTAYNRILRGAEIPVSRKTKTHALRVSHATWLKVMGGDPTRQLMHGDQRTTERSYLDPRFLASQQPKLFIPWAG